MVALTTVQLGQSDAIFGDRSKVILDVLRHLGKGTANVITAEIERAYRFESMIEARQFAQGVHGTLSKLYEEGRVNRPRTVIDAQSGAEVYEYELSAAGTGKRVKNVAKQYKVRYEEALAVIKERDEQIETLIMMKQRVENEVEELKAKLAAATKAE